MTDKTRGNWRQENINQEERNEDDYKSRRHLRNDESYRSTRQVYDSEHINDDMTHQARRHWRQGNGSQEERNENDFRNRRRLRNDERYRSTDQVYDPEHTNGNNTTLLLAVGRLEGRLQETKLDGNRGYIKQTFNASVLKYITSKVQIVEHITDICCRYDSHDSSAIGAQIDFLLIPLLRDEEEITIQEIEDVQLEMSRLKRMVELSRITKIYSRSGSWMNEKLQNIEKLVASKKRYSEITDKEVEKQLKNLNSGIQISNSERLEIVKAMGLSKGHWFKCPNGHPYVITECGGAMQEFDCPECGERIGGSQHTLIRSNQLAPEMDGAQFAAWSDVANNMENYDLRQFQFN